MGKNAYQSTITFNIDGLVLECGNSSANALELLQSWAKPLIHCSLVMPFDNIDLGQIWLT